MRLLILGGTQFLGRHFADQAVAAGHDVTVFHRGKTAPGSVAGATEVLGDRDGGLGALGTATFDAVIDTSGYLPRVVRQSAEAFRGRTPYYLFVSTISVYADFSRAGIQEGAATIVLDDPASEDVSAHYGGLKVLCEQAVLDVVGAERTCLVRPGLIVGPLDPTDRFTYWPMRLGRPGPVLVPGRPGQRVQWIDVRDLAAWMLRLAEAGTTGVFNATGPATPCTFGAFLEGTMDALGRHPRLVAADETFLLDSGVAQWMDLPMWLAAQSNMDGMLKADIRAALDAGLTLRPLGETVRDTAAWAQTAGRWRSRTTGLRPARERELLAAHRDGVAAKA